MLQFSTIKPADLPLPKARFTSEKTLIEKFNEKKFEILRREKRKLREFHFITLEHDGFLFVLNGLGKVQGKLENPNDIKTRRKAREIYVEAIRGSENHQGGCYFN
jgi:hypothetical protein